MKMVDIKDLTFKYTSAEDGLEKFAVNGVSLEVEKGEFLRSEEHTSELQSL